MNIKSSTRFASLLCAVMLVVPATACDLGIPDINVDGGTDGGEDEDQDEGEDEDEDEDEDEGGGKDSVGPAGDDSGPSDDESGDDGIGDDGIGDDESGDDESGDDGISDDGTEPPMPGSECASYCAVELSCDSYYPSMEECMSECEANTASTGECQGEYNGLNACLGSLDCDAFVAYWNALAAVEEGTDPGTFPCMDELIVVLECFETTDGGA